MFGIVVLSLIFILPAVLLLIYRGRRTQASPTSAKLTMLYAPGSTDIAGEVYHSSRKDGAMPFPLGKKKERKKTETFRRHTED